MQLPQAKAGARSVILSAAARKILAGQLEGHQSEWVFPTPAGRPYSREQIGKVFRRFARGSAARPGSPAAEGRGPPSLAGRAGAM